MPEEEIDDIHSVTVCGTAWWVNPGTYAALKKDITRNPDGCVEIPTIEGSTVFCRYRDIQFLHYSNAEMRRTGRTLNEAYEKESKEWE